MGKRFFGQKWKEPESGILFDSKTEGLRFQILRDAERKGIIRDLKQQVNFVVLPKQTKDVEVQLKTKTKIVTKTIEQAVDYTADFTYYKDDEYIVEEVKGTFNSKVVSRDYPLRRKLLLYTHGIELKQVDSKHLTDI